MSITVAELADQLTNLPNWLLALVRRLDRIEALVTGIDKTTTTAQPLAVHEVATEEAADVLLVPHDWRVTLYGVQIGTLISNSYGERSWHALWWTGSDDDKVQHSEMLPTREAAIEAMVKAHRAEAEAVAA